MIQELPTSTDTTKVASVPWLQDLRRDLHAGIEHECEVTVQVAVCLANKMSTKDIKDTLGVSDLDIKVSKERLARVIGQWEN